MATPAVQPPAPVPQQGPSPERQPAAASTRPAQPAAPPPADQQPTPAEPEPEPKKRRWGRKDVPKVPGVQGGAVSGPRVQAPRVAAPRVNVGPGGVKVSGPRVQAPRVQAPRVKAPKVKQPKIPTSPQGFLDMFKKAKVPSVGGGKGGGSSGAVAEGPVAPQPAETWHWDAVGQRSGRGKGLLVLLLLLLLAAGGAAAGWYFLVREDDGAPAAAAAAPVTTKAYVARLQPLLLRSSQDRARISSAVTRVAACTLAPSVAARQIGQTVRGRRAVLTSVRRLPASNARTTKLSALLGRSLSTSAAAGTSYLRWIDSFDGACPARSGPNYARALAGNGQAQAAKTAFARAYNPIARSVGARSWSASQF